MQKFVIIDVETTGVSFEKGDRIIQVAYVMIENKQIVERYSSYVQPERSIPRFIQTLTNITEKQVKEAPLFAEIAPKLLEALDGAFFVAHNVEFDLQFINAELEAAGYEAFQGPILDTVELSRIAFPTASGFKLSQLSEGLSVNHDQPHRADSDAEATAELFIQIVEKLKNLPYETLVQLDKLKANLKSDMNSLSQQWLMENCLKGEGDFDIYRGIALRKQKSVEQGNTEEEIPSFAQFFENNLSNEAWCKEKMEGYEQREGQLQMMSFTFDEMKNRQMAFIEAGTGTGKSLGYLIPALFLAKETKKPVVISTYTVQLQEQLLKNEIKKVEAFLPFSIKTALLKGRNHYLCLRKFENLLKNDPYDTYDRTISKAQILVWLTETETGDVEELSLASKTNKFWYDICSDSFSCTSPKCPWFSRCFYQRARKNAKDADLIITNHSLVLSDVQADHQLIPSYQHIILDEAHHFEDTATELFGLTLDYLSVTHLMNELKQGEDIGLLPYLYKEIKSDISILPEVTQVEEASQQLKQEWNDLFLLLNDYIHAQKGSFNESGRETVEINFNNKGWEPISEAISRTELYYKEWEMKMVLLYDQLHDKRSFWENGLIERLESIIDRGRKIYETFTKLFIHLEESYVYWLESETRGPRQAISIFGKPIQVSQMLADEFFNKKESVILTSATLTVNNTFDYVIQRLGLEDFSVETQIVASPFQWKDQVQLMISKDMPLIQECGENAYVEAVAMHIYRITQVSKGKMLVLFTSYEMLRKTYYQLKELLNEEYNLIAQGVQTGSRTKLTKNFQQFEKSILLGTSSFWEGVDIPGDDLTVTVIVRLPFTPPNDPVFQAKSTLMKQEGKNAFMKLALPQAILRFKQGFGRLIRRSSDKGVVIVLDRRIVATRYGKQFIKSLPPIEVVDESMDVLEEELSKWL